uniref:glucuronosyltransferase n=1 Tax=Meloidogyne javanica TaxID=6303 RepID=A0A915LMC3_MELJA
MLAKTLSENYFVDILVYSKENGEPIEFNPMPNDLQIIKMNVDKNHLDQEKLASKGQWTAYNEFKRSKGYRVKIFEDLIKDQHILEHLRQQGYHFGIADLAEMAGSFAIFELLGIENTFNVLPAIVLPALYQFFGINIAQEIREGQTIIPATRFSKPGDWVFTHEGCHFKEDRFVANLKEHIFEIYSTRKYYQEVAIYAGVPLICIPYDGDQFLNSSLIEHLGIGIFVSLWENNKSKQRKNPAFGNEFTSAVAEMLGK